MQIDGRTERVGFYNTFVGRMAPDTVLPDGVRVEADPETGDLHAVYGPHYRGIQFHTESILTEHGYDLVHRLVQICCWTDISLSVELARIGLPDFGDSGSFWLRNSQMGDRIGIRARW